MNRSGYDEMSDSLRGDIETRLEALLPAGDERPSSLHKAMRYAVLSGGKRIRAILCVHMHDVAGGKHRDSAISAGCAIECLHAYTLIHDDLPVIDDDDMRRGKPSTHKEYGEAIALLAGDALQALSFEILTGLDDVPSGSAISAANILAVASGSTMLVGGQVADIEGEGGIQDAATVNFIHTRKTAALIAASMSIGAAIAGADEKSLGAVREAGMKAGLAFQIIDDILDVEGDEDVTGKGLRKDSKKGKITWPGCFGLEESRSKAQKLVEESISAIRTLGDDGRIESVLRMITGRVS